MEIEYLTKLRDNPARYPDSDGYKATIKALPLLQIQELEQSYNSSNPFPKALKELMFLAGQYCYVLDYGLYKSQKELQDSVREYMIEENRVIDRPFLAIDVYNDGDQFLFVYLDDGDDPVVYEAHYYDRDDRPNWITLVSNTLSSYIESLIERVTEGRNPF